MKPLHQLPLPNPSQTYDYIIAGSGAAGLSLVMRMLKHPQLKNKQILLIDADEKKQNDRTWCFWEMGQHYFENVVHHCWQQLEFSGTYGKRLFNIAPYQYKMIRGSDFYAFCFEELKKYSNIYGIRTPINGLQSKAQTAYVTTNDGVFTAQYVFNSIPTFNPSEHTKQPKQLYPLLQHFKGWIIETEQPQFDPQKAVFMDFDVPQNKGTAFVYLLPVNANRALVEYTFFNKQVLDDAVYDDLIKDYLQGRNIHQYKIIETEKGVIPMTNQRFETAKGNIVHLGTAGGQTKASSGFTFQFIQKHSAAIVTQLANQQSPIVHSSITNKRFRLYDAVLLHVLYQQKMEGKAIFSDILKSGNIQQLFRFLDNESTLIEELNIMYSVPTSIFLKAAIHELFN